MPDLLDAHMHTVASVHAYSTIQEMATAGKKRGLKLIGITDHAPAMPGGFHKMYFCNFKVIPRKAYGIEIRMGTELNIIDYTGSTDLQEKILRRLDYAVASLHDVCIPPGSVEQNTNAIIGSMRNPKVKIIGHPDNPDFPVDFDKLALAAKENKVLLEINNSSHTPGNDRGTKEGAAALLTACRKHGTMVVMDSDAHIDLDVGNHTFSMQRVKENNFPEELIINSDPELFKKWIEN